MLDNTAGKGGHRVDEEPGSDRIRIPLAIAISGDAAPCNHHTTAEGIDRGAAHVIAIVEERVGDHTEALKVAPCLFSIERSYEVMDLSKASCKLTPLPEFGRSGIKEALDLHLVVLV